MATEWQNVSAVDTNQSTSSLAVWLATSACLSWLAIGLVLLSRRFAGALSQPLSMPTLWACGFLMALLVWTIRQLWDTSTIGLQWFLSTVAIGMTAWSISLPATSAVGLIGLWTIIVLAEAIWIANLVRSRRLDPGQSMLPTSALASAEDMQPDPTVIQQLVRSRDADGREMLAGKVQVVFHATEKITRSHVAFSPPFSAIPEVYVEPLVTTDSDVMFQCKSHQAFPHGTRIDVRLDQPAEEDTHVWLELYAIWEPQ